MSFYPPETMKASHKSPYGTNHTNTLRSGLSRRKWRKHELAQHLGLVPGAPRSSGMPDRSARSVHVTDPNKAASPGNKRVNNEDNYIRVDIL